MSNQKTICKTCGRELRSENEKVDMMCTVCGTIQEQLDLLNVAQAANQNASYVNYLIENASESGILTVDGSSTKKDSEINKLMLSLFNMVISMSNALSSQSVMIGALYNELYDGLEMKGFDTYIEKLKNINQHINNKIVERKETENQEMNG